MLKHNLKISFRNLWKNKSFSTINIAGLAIGIAACLLILQYVSFKLSFDRFHKYANTIYRVVNDRYQQGKLIQHGTITYSGIGKAMQNDFPEVINHTRVVPVTGQILIHENEKIGDQKGLAVDNSFLSIFSYPIIAGDRQTALSDPNSLVIAETLARKFFKINNNDFESLIGKEVIMQWDSVPNKITAVCKDVPENSHLEFDFLWSYVSLHSGKNPWKATEYNFREANFWQYIQIKPGIDHKKLEAKFPAFSEKYFQGNKVSGSDEKFYLQPLTKAHLYSGFEYEIGKTGNGTVVWGLLIIAVLIIVIAWVNFVNLTTARSMERAREVGVRKVTGATKKQLIKQFLTESFLINAIAIALGLLIVIIIQDGFNNLVQHRLSLSSLFQQGLGGLNVFLLLAAVIICGIFVSGFYPAFMLSSFKPILVLKGKFTTTAKGTVLRKALVIGQFAITVALIIGSFVVYRQIKFVNSRDLGINLSQILVVKGPNLTDWDSSFINRQYSFIERVKQISNVSGAAFSAYLPGNETARSFDVYLSDRPSDKSFTLRRYSISSDFVNVYQVKLLAGRNFIRNDYNPEIEKVQNIVLNEKAAQLLGFTSVNDAIGKQINTGEKRWDIIGVVADFHQKSLHHPIEPTFFIPNSTTWSPFSIRVNPRNLSSTIAAIGKTYDDFFPGNLFDYYFLDERFNQQYNNDKLFGNVFAIFAGLGIFIASLGLFGLSLFATMRRTKEIGVRKVLGASVSSVVMLLSKDFIKLIIIAIVIASPVAMYIMNSWLRDFAYRITISWWMFVAAGVLVILIALITMSIQTIRSAMTNPVKSLRTE